MMRAIGTVLAATALAGCSMLPGGREDTRQSVRQAASAPANVGPAPNQCLADLGTSRASFSPLPDRYYGAGCSTLNSVQLSAVHGDEGQFGVANIGPVACPLANTFAAWARYGVDRAARQYLGSPLARIETFGSYSCRNVAGTSRRSAHSTATAIDVSAFVLADGRRITLVRDWNEGSAQERAFLRIVHESACKRFGTVLGPDYNEAHRDHFHLEQGGSSYCR